MRSPIDCLADLVIGTVDSVAPHEIRVSLDAHAPANVALNTGTPSSFPRLNSYLLIPNEVGATVAYITYIGIERSPLPAAVARDRAVIDLPFPIRRMHLSPIGTLLPRERSRGAETSFELSRGVLAFPSVGDQVLLPTSAQVEAIVGARSADRRVRIGTSPMGAPIPIMVDPDKVFGRHLAVLGNTGSGKSCSVAGLIRWSLEAAKLERRRSGSGVPNARFIILDPNGEYARAFSDMGKALRVFRVPPLAGDERQLEVPAWLWSGHEWATVAQAQPGAQRPLLLQGLRELKAGTASGIPREAVVRRYLESYILRVAALLSTGTHAFAGTPAARFACARLLETVVSDCTQFATSVPQDKADLLENVANLTNTVRESRKSGQYYNDFSVSDLEAIRDALRTVANALPDAGPPPSISEDSPGFFDVQLLPEHLSRIALEQGGNVAGFVATLELRIRGMLADPRLGSIISGETAKPFEAWLDDYIGADEAANGALAIVDLSLVPSEIVHVIVSVLGRLIFEALQRYRRAHPQGRALPTVLVLEEAHSFVRRGREDDGPAASPSHLCKEVFERIAREGRKFGLGLVLSSQRPAELSPTVLAQCNTFLLHRIVNDADQTLVSRLVPDNVGGLLRELPSLPSRQAILLGWAAPIPLLVEMDELPEQHRPQSADPDFWAVWTGEHERPIDWGHVVSRWSEAPTSAQPMTAPDTPLPREE